MIEFWENGSTSVTIHAMTPVIFDAAPEQLTAVAPAASVLTYLTELDSASNNVIATLADGLVDGQMKRVIASVVTNTTSLTLASAVSASLDIITFTIIGDTVDLIWNAEAGYWRIIQLLDTDRDVDTPTVA